MEPAANMYNLTKQGKKLFSSTVWLLGMALRKWRDIKLQPSISRSGPHLSCCLVPSNSLVAVKCALIDMFATPSRDSQREIERDPHLLSRFSTSQSAGAAGAGVGAAREKDP